MKHICMEYPAKYRIEQLPDCIKPLWNGISSKGMNGSCRLVRKKEKDETIKPFFVRNDSVLRLTIVDFFTQEILSLSKSNRSLIYISITAQFESLRELYPKFSQKCHADNISGARSVRKRTYTSSTIIFCKVIFFLSFSRN